MNHAQGGLRHGGKLGIGHQGGQLPAGATRSGFQCFGEIGEIGQFSVLLQRLDTGFEPVHALAHQWPEPLVGLQAAFREILEQGFQRMAQIADPEQARKACVTLERVQAAHEAVDGFLGGEVVFPGGQVFLEPFGDLAGLLEEEFEQFRVHLGRNRLGLFLCGRGLARPLIG